MAHRLSTRNQLIPPGIFTMDAQGANTAPPVPAGVLFPARQSHNSYPLDRFLQPARSMGRRLGSGEVGGCDGPGRRGVAVGALSLVPAPAGAVAPGPTPAR